MSVVCIVGKMQVQLDYRRGGEEPAKRTVQCFWRQMEETPWGTGGREKQADPSPLLHKLDLDALLRLVF